MLKKLLLVALLLVFIMSSAVTAVVVWGYNYFSRDLPNFHTVADYQPKQVSQIFASDGSLVAEVYDERRYPFRLNEVPRYVSEAFLAAEDASFYTHPGIDLISIARAFVKNLRTGSVKQGGSTITQQVVKNLLLTRERSLERKIKEAILAYRLEQRLSKDDILEIYLNQIFLGNGAYGLKSAAHLYFQKPVSELTLAEGAMLAGLPQLPSRYSPVKSFVRAKRRQDYVLQQMERAGFITPEQGKKARAEEITVHRAWESSVSRAPYYVSEVKRIFEERWPELNLSEDGLRIHTALDLRADELAQQAVRRGLREVDKRQGWRGPLTHLQTDSDAVYAKRFGGKVRNLLQPGTSYPALVKSVSNGLADLQLGSQGVRINLTKSSWARKQRGLDGRVFWSRPEKVLRAGDIVEVALDESYTSPVELEKIDLSFKNLFLDQTPELGSGLVLLDPHSGRVLTVIGGFDFRDNQFNRATQARRQPGSAFKPIVYLTAIDQFGYTPATIVHDEPRSFKVGLDYWTPRNYDKTYIGPITLQTALEKSRNLISADIIARIGVDSVIRQAKQLGIESDLGRNLSLSLGSSEVSVLELVRAYGVLAARGMLFESVFITRIEGRNGETIYDYDQEKLTKVRRVVDENSAFIMAHMMKGVVERGTGYRVRSLGRPVAGKTGTSNDQMDAWFLGYTPEWACGVWVGFDTKQSIGPKETGGVVSAPIWLYLMEPFLKYQDEKKHAALIADAKAESKRLGLPYQEPKPPTPLDFPVPTGVDPYWIDRSSGLGVEPGTPGAILQYFRKGTEPPVTSNQVQELDYWDSEQF